MTKEPHSQLGVSAGIEAVQLVEQLQHGSLDLSLAAAVAVVPLGAHRVDFVDEDDAGTVLVSHSEQFADQLGTVAEVLLDQLTAHLAMYLIKERVETEQGWLDEECG